MENSQGRFASFFSGGLKIVDSTGQIHLYKRQLNQNAIYFVMVGGVVRHTGGYKHCREMFNTYRRYYEADYYLYA